MRVAGVEGLPEPIGGTAGRIQGRLGEAAIVRDQAQKFVAPYLGMKNIGISMQDEVPAGMGICTIEAEQRAGFLATDTRHLRFIGIEGSEDLGR